MFVSPLSFFSNTDLSQRILIEVKILSTDILRFPTAVGTEGLFQDLQKNIWGFGQDLQKNIWGFGQDLQKNIWGFGQDLQKNIWGFGKNVVIL